jgi:SnoaL-like domain
MIRPSNGDRLADREARRELRAAYSHYWDEGLVEEFVQLFTQDGLLQLATLGYARGHDQLRDAARQGMSHSRFIVHFTSDEMTEFTGDNTARGESRLAVHIGREQPGQGAGTYVDEYLRTAEGWRFVSHIQRFFYMGPREGGWPPAPEPLEAPMSRNFPAGTKEVEGCLEYLIDS